MLIIYLLMLLSTTQETGKVIGRIIREEGKAATGAAISIINTDIITSVDSTGYFELEVPAGKHILLRRMMGYSSTAIFIEVKAGSVLDLGTLTFGLGYYYNAESHDKKAGTPDLKANASELVSTTVTPHLEQEIEEGKNVLWCTTYQLAWNELCDLVGGPVKVKSPSKMVDILNKRKTNKKDLDEKDYVAMAGKGDTCIDEIRYELKRKFEGQASPELLEKHTQIYRNWITYAYLFKHLPFENVFIRYYNKLDFQGKLVDYFGVPGYRGTERLEKVAEQVIVLDYKNDDDFIIELKTTSKDDRLILAKISPKETLEETVKSVEYRIKKVKPSKTLQYETVRIPVFDFDILRKYNELLGDTIKVKDKFIDGTTIDVAAQSIRFRLDETGALLKSGAAIVTSDGTIPKRRNFIFDKPFLILLKQKEAKNPYFALWVGNSELLVSTKKD
jgi:hypothetical protein